MPSFEFNNLAKFTGQHRDVVRIVSVPDGFTAFKEGDLALRGDDDHVMRITETAGQIFADSAQVHQVPGLESKLVTKLHANDIPQFIGGYPYFKPGLNEKQQEPFLSGKPCDVFKINTPLIPSGNEAQLPSGTLLLRGEGKVCMVIEMDGEQARGRPHQTFPFDPQEIAHVSGVCAVPKKIAYDFMSGRYFPLSQDALIKPLFLNGRTEDVFGGHGRRNVVRVNDPEEVHDILMATSGVLKLEKGDLLLEGDLGHYMPLTIGETMVYPKATEVFQAAGPVGERMFPLDSFFASTLARSATLTRRDSPFAATGGEYHQDFG